MFSLQKQRVRGDLIQVFEALNNFDQINPEKLFHMYHTTVIEGHGMKLKWHNVAQMYRKHSSIYETESQP